MHPRPSHFSPESVRFQPGDVWASLKKKSMDIRGILDTLYTLLANLQKIPAKYLPSLFKSKYARI